MRESNGSVGADVEDLAGVGDRAGNGRGGRLHFVKFETSRLEDALAFIEAKARAEGIFFGGGGEGREREGERLRD